MKKRAYFKHDVFAMASEKLSKLIDYEGTRGYGIYWMVLEVLRSRKDFKWPLRELGRLARTCRTQKKTLVRVLRDYDLFEVEGDYFYSPGMLRRLESLISAAGNSEGKAEKGDTGMCPAEHRDGASGDGPVGEAADGCVEGWPYGKMGGKIDGDEDKKTGGKACGQVGEQVGEHVCEQVGEQLSCFHCKTLETKIGRSYSVRKGIEGKERKEKSNNKKDAVGVGNADWVPVVGRLSGNSVVVKAREALFGQAVPAGVDRAGSSVAAGFSGSSALQVGAGSFVAAESSDSSAPKATEVSSVAAVSSGSSVPKARAGSFVAAESSDSSVPKATEVSSVPVAEVVAIPPETPVSSGDIPPHRAHWEEVLDKIAASPLNMERLAMHSRMGILFLNCQQEVVESFRKHVRLYGRERELLDECDLMRYFANYLIPGSHTWQRLEEALRRKTSKEESGGGIRSPYEDLLNGQRMYLGRPIPPEAPPRPSGTAVWDETNHRWIR